MNLLSMLAATSDIFTGKLAFLGPIVEAINSVITPILIVVASVGVIYAIYLGVNMAKAEDAEKRAEAKKRIINAVIALAVTIVLILLLQLFAQNIGTWVGAGIPIEEETATLIHLL